MGRERCETGGHLFEEHQGNATMGEIVPGGACRRDTWGFDALPQGSSLHCEMLRPLGSHPHLVCDLSRASASFMPGAAFRTSTYYPCYNNYIWLITADDQRRRGVLHKLSPSVSKTHTKVLTPPSTASGYISLGDT